jgi:hypothetical protein
MPQESEGIVGRKKEFQSLLSSLRDRQSRHIYGPKGMGKTALLDWAHRNWREIEPSLVPIYSRSSRTLREIFLYIAPFLLDYFKHLESVAKFKETRGIRYASDIKKLNIRTLRNLIFSHITLGNFCVLLDHLEYVTPRINGLLTVLQEKAPVISASRESWDLKDYGFRGRLNCALYLTPKLKLEELGRTDIYSLLDIYSDGIFDSEKDEDLYKEIFHLSKGNPGLAKEIIQKARLPKYRLGENINLKLVMLDLEIEGIGRPR